LEKVTALTANPVIIITSRQIHYFKKPTAAKGLMLKCMNDFFLE